MLPTIPAITTGVALLRQSCVTSANTASGDFPFRRVTPASEYLLSRHLSPWYNQARKLIAVKYDDAGFYGIKCTPHYAQGMVMLIKVGDATLPDTYRAFKAPGIADKRFQEIYSRIEKQ